MLDPNWRTSLDCSKEREEQTDKHIHRNIDRQTERQSISERRYGWIDRQTDKNKDSHMNGTPNRYWQVDGKKKWKTDKQIEQKRAVSRKNDKRTNRQKDKITKDRHNYMRKDRTDRQRERNICSTVSGFS